jgi:hypothetical protein
MLAEIIFEKEKIVVPSTITFGDFSRKYLFML